VQLDGAAMLLHHGSDGQGLLVEVRLPLAPSG
jgi:hypothetical protein